MEVFINWKYEGLHDGGVSGGVTTSLTEKCKLTTCIHMYAHARSGWLQKKTETGSLVVQQDLAYLFIQRDDLCTYIIYDYI